MVRLMVFFFFVVMVLFWRIVGLDFMKLDKRFWFWIVKASCVVVDIGNWFWIPELWVC